jgi:amino acid adenylation domain-containing protein
MIVALLAIIKAGAAYLPLDPLFPPERLGYMLSDSGSRLLITEKSLRETLPAFAGTIVQLDDEGWRANGRDNPAVAVKPDDLGYVIYTSGSTGKPKGVQLPRKAMTNLLWTMREWLQLTNRDRLLAVTTISFDIASADVWLPLLVGAQTVVASFEAASDGNALQDLLQRHDITFLQATPVTWRLLFDAGWRGKANLQTVCTGEAMPHEVAVQLVPVVKRVWNLYGPTETTIWSTGYEITDGRETILIGRPVFNTQCYILDARRELVPAGVTGELYIAGDGLARGYLNRPELTAEKFVADPFAGGAARMYRTGDLARYRPDGNIECLGRIDHQVKLRGYRIELGEIEARLAEYPGVREAVVIAREDTPGDKRLVAYYAVSTLADAEKGNIGAEQFRAYLSTDLPEYMIPAAYVRMEALPLTPNGKIDREALPAPEIEAYSTRGYEPPEGETDTKLAAIWSNVLKVDRVGRHDNFFDLGGHSLMAARAVALMNQEFGTSLPIRILFQANTVSQLAAAIGKRGTAREAEWPSLIPIQRSGTRLPLFCVARPNVNALGYLMLSRELGSNQPVYGLQVQLEEDPDVDFSEEQIHSTATEYIRTMKTVQAHGPYNLIGECQGAYIAFEMVQQLECSGEEATFLGILDAWTEENTRHKWAFHVHLALWRIRHLDIRELKEALGRVRSKIFRREASNPQMAQEAVPRPKKKTLMERYFPGEDFVPPVCSCPITVFKVRKQAWYRKKDQTHGWNDRTRSGVTVRTVPGEHHTFTRQPHVRELAAMIAVRLAESESANSELLRYSATG